MKLLLKTLKYVLIATASLLCLILLVGGILFVSRDSKEPSIDLSLAKEYTLHSSDSLRTYGPNTLRLDKTGLWEMQLHGTAPQRGMAFGQMAEDLLYYQEKVFVDQIREIIPSDSYLHFLRYLIGIFNRNLGKHVPLEQREEIAALSQSCTDEFDAIGTPYERQLNYHAAHDIGHSMQDYMLVGCSAFAAWGSDSADSSLIIGRNFDFYVGDDFARHKIIAFYFPSQGYRFASLTWPGMIGVLSGMNEKGLTVSINAAKADLPLSAAMPISLLSRQILQYASNIEEAYSIASKHKIFVAESILIGSAQDGRAAIIEKSPKQIALYESPTQYLVQTNHFQSDSFVDNPRNAEQIAQSDSPYRHKRLQELIRKQSPIDQHDAASILRNRLGLADREIGLKNEMSINQLIAHHAVIFKPKELIMWVSTAPWQLGSMQAYDLKEVFANKAHRASPLAQQALCIEPDTLLSSPVMQQVYDYERLKKKLTLAIKENRQMPSDSLEAFKRSNPSFFYTWQLLGDYYITRGDKAKAIKLWQLALDKEIPKMEERQAIKKRIKKQK